MLDEDLARLYEVETRTLIQAVKRKKDRFPEDFMFQLTKDEYANLRSQIVISRFGEVGEVLPTPSPSRASPCSPGCSTAMKPRG